MILWPGALGPRAHILCSSVFFKMLVPKRIIIIIIIINCLLISKCIRCVSVCCLFFVAFCEFPKERLLACAWANRTSSLTFKPWTTCREDSGAFQSDLHWFCFSVSPCLSSKGTWTCTEASPACLLSGIISGPPGMMPPVDVWSTSRERLLGRSCCGLGCSPEVESLVGQLMLSNPKWKNGFCFCLFVCFSF